MHVEVFSRPWGLDNRGPARLELTWDPIDEYQQGWAPHYDDKASFVKKCLFTLKRLFSEKSFKDLLQKNDCEKNKLHHEVHKTKNFL